MEKMIPGWKMRGREASQGVSASLTDISTQETMPLS